MHNILQVANNKLRKDILAREKAITVLCITFCPKFRKTKTKTSAKSSIYKSAIC